MTDHDQGPNHGRQFYCCARSSRKEQCKMFAWADECNADGGAGAGIGGGVWGESKAATARGNADGGGDGRLCKKHQEPCAVFKVKKEVSMTERN